MSDRPVRSAVKALIVQDGKLLTVRGQDSDGAYYSLPGGGQIRGETLHEALRRECREEVSVDVEVGPLRYVRDYIAAHHEFARQSPDFHQVEFWFRCRLADGQSAALGDTPDPEQTGVAWLPLNDLGGFRLYPAVLKTLPLHAEAESGATPAATVYLGDVN